MTTTSTHAPTAAPPGRRLPGPGLPSIGHQAPIVSLDPMKLLQQYYRWLIAAGILGVILGFVMYFGLAMTFPRFNGVVDFQVYPEPESDDDPGNRVSSVGGRDEMEAYMQTQVLVMTSDQILTKVTEERAFRDTKWAATFKAPDGQINRADALIELKKIVGARRIPETSVIRMVVRSPDKYDSTTIANTISVVFLDFVRQLSTRDLRDLLQQFEAQARDLRQDISQLDTRMETLFTRTQMTSMRAENSVAANEIKTLQPEIVRVRTDLSHALEQLKSFEEMLARPGGIVYPDRLRSEVENSPLVARQVALISEEKARMRALSMDRGENDLTIRKQRNFILALEESLEELRQSQLADMFAAQVESLRNGIQGLKATESQLMGHIQRASEKLAEITTQEKMLEDMRSEREKKLMLAKDTEEKIKGLQTRLNRPIRVRELSRATPPDQMAFPRIIPTVLLCAFLVPAAVGGFVALREIREQRVRGPQDIALIPRMRVLGVMPDLSMDPTNPEKIEHICVDRPAGVIAEAVRQLRTSLLKEARSHGHRVILMVGGLPGAGVTSLISNLASNAAATDCRVLIIDANLRRPRMHVLYGKPDRPGLSDVLLGTVALEDAIVPTAQANLSLLPAGQRETQVFERFLTASMSNIIDQARQQYDLVLIDVPPAVVSSDAMAIAGHADAVVLVARAFNEKRGLVARLRNQLVETKAEFLGVIVNAVQASAGGYLRRNILAQHAYGREDDQAVTKDETPHDPTKNGTIKSVS